jgi:hypothetical protein
MVRPRCATLVLTALVTSLWPSFVGAQERETLFGGNAVLGAAWGIESDVTKIQNDLSATLGAVLGVTINRATTLATTFGANVSHPTVNYGYFGVVARRALRSEELLHGAASVRLVFASTKDYERAKSSLFDNFGNTGGEHFGFLEPAALAEINLTGRMRLRVGLGYRIVWGLDEATEFTTRTRVSGSDFSGPSFSIGLGS